MLLNRLWANDGRFKSLNFQSGLNLLVAERTSSSELGDSRNGTGKSSFTRILRYIFGGNLPQELSSKALSDHEFAAALTLPGNAGATQEDVTVRRRVSPSTRVVLEGWSQAKGGGDQHVEQWRELQAEALFNIPAPAIRHTASQLWGVLIR